MAACVVRLARDCVRCSLAKAMLQLEENELCSHREFLCVWWRGVSWSPLK